MKEIKQLKRMLTPKNLSPYSMQGYVYAYRAAGVDFVVMASSRQRLSKIAKLMGEMNPVNMRMVKKVILVGLK